jgi:phosphoglycerate kinase
MAGFRTLDSLEVKGKRVLLRVDLNVPIENGIVTDATRIARVAPTVTELADKGAKVILLSHFGRPKGRDPRYSLKPVVAEIARIIKRPVKFAADCVGDIAERAVADMKSGQILCLENTRFHAGEEKNDPAFVDALAKLGDLWVNDAFSAAHRAHASTEGLGHRLPAFAGRAMQAELEALAHALEHPRRPLTAIVGGAKISTKIDLLGHLLKKVDRLIIGGAMANTLLLAQGRQIGKSLVEPDLVATAKQILAEARSQQREIVLPLDAIVAKKFESRAPARAVEVGAVDNDDIILDIGPRTIEHIIAALERSHTLVWNGPLGAFETEPFDSGTREVAKAAANLGEVGKLVTVAGGGDTVAALNAAGVADRFTYVSTAGGAFLEWLEGKVLPGVEVLRIK